MQRLLCIVHLSDRKSDERSTVRRLTSYLHLRGCWQEDTHIKKTHGRGRKDARGAALFVVCASVRLAVVVMCWLSAATAAGISLTFLRGIRAPVHSLALSLCCTATFVSWLFFLIQGPPHRSSFVCQRPTGKEHESVPEYCTVLFVGKASARTALQAADSRQAECWANLSIKRIYSSEANH